jgi:hypothetical protein
MVNQTNDNGQIVFLISLIAVMLILPLFLYLMASMYFDMLVVATRKQTTSGHYSPPYYSTGGKK